MHAQLGSNYINSTLKFHILRNVLLGIYSSGRVWLIWIFDSSKKVKIRMIANTLLYSSQGNIGDCFIREYRSTSTVAANTWIASSRSMTRRVIPLYKLLKTRRISSKLI